MTTDRAPDPIIAAVDGSPSSIEALRYASRLADALHQQAFAALTSSPGARAYYDALRDRQKGHHQALRALANRLVGILHGCLRHQCRYDEATAWPTTTDNTTTAAA